MTTNPFKDIADFYNESVEKSDSLGFAGLFKKATESLFTELKSYYEHFNKSELTIMDVEYLDGYFVFGTGTNSVVHFHIKETPGWKYGIWWNAIKKKDHTEENPSYEENKVHCQIFTQYEEEIDKFKPAASMVQDEFTVSLGDPECIPVGTFVHNIEFIRNEPYLAFYREMHWTNFNLEYVSREKAKRYFDKHHKERKSQEEAEALNHKEMLEVAYTILKPFIDAGFCYIEDRGDNWSPRYEIVMKNLWEDEALQGGCYDLYGVLRELDVDVKAAKKLINKKEKECKKRADKVGLIWHRSYHDSVFLFSSDKYPERFKTATKVNFESNGDNQ